MFIIEKFNFRTLANQKIYRQMDGWIDRLTNLPIFISIQNYDGKNQYQNTSQLEDRQMDGWIDGRIDSMID